MFIQSSTALDEWWLSPTEHGDIFCHFSLKAFDVVLSLIETLSLSTHNKVLEKKIEK